MENVVPSALPAHGHGFTDSVLPNFQLLSLDETANAPPIGHPSIERPAPPVGLGDLVPVDQDVYSLLLELKSMDPDIEEMTRPRRVDPFHLPTTMGQEPQQQHPLHLSNVGRGFLQGTTSARRDFNPITPLFYPTMHPAISPPLPVTIGYGSPQGPAPELRSDHTTPSCHPTVASQDARPFYPTTKPPLPLAVGCRSPQGSQPLHGPTRVGRPAVAMPRHVNYITTRQVLSCMGVKGGNKRVCLCRNSMGEVCGFTSKPDLIARHIRRVHFKLG